MAAARRADTPRGQADDAGRPGVFSDRACGGTRSAEGVMGKIALERLERCLDWDIIWRCAHFRHWDIRH